jgi:hypothetical protein
LLKKTSRSMARLLPFMKLCWVLLSIPCV